MCRLDPDWLLYLVRRLHKADSDQGVESDQDQGLVFVDVSLSKEQGVNAGR